MKRMGNYTNGKQSQPRYRVEYHYTKSTGWRARLYQVPIPSNLSKISRQTQRIIQAYNRDPVQFRKRMVVWANRHRQIQEDMGRLSGALSKEKEQVVGCIQPGGCSCNRRVESRQFDTSKQSQDMERSLSFPSGDKRWNDAENTSEEDHCNKQLFYGTMFSQGRRSSTDEKKVQTTPFPYKYIQLQLGKRNNQS